MSRRDRGQAGPRERALRTRSSYALSIFMYFDSHCHLTDTRFASDLDEVLARAEDVGVEGIVTIASDVDDAEAVVRLVDERLSGRTSGHPVASPAIWGTAGIHPHVAGEADAGDLDRLRDLLTAHATLVAVGEVGLDYHYDNSPRDVQRRLFREQAILARELDLPLVVHSRDADADTIALLREIGGETRGVLHCFTSGPELLEVGVEIGWYVSYSGIASFGSFDGGEGVRLVPRERLLIETDAPYLAPDPVRGKRNEPFFVPHVAAAVGRIREEDPEEVGRYTAANARTFYGLAA